MPDPVLFTVRLNVRRCGDIPPDELKPLPDPSVWGELRDLLATAANDFIRLQGLDTDTYAET